MKRQRALVRRQPRRRRKISKYLVNLIYSFICFVNELSSLINPLVVLQLLITINTAWFVPDICELLRQHALLAESALETVSVPNGTARVDALLAYDSTAAAALCFVFSGTRSALQDAGVENSRVRFEWLLADGTLEMLLVPVNVLHLRWLAKNRLVTLCADALGSIVIAALASKTVFKDATGLWMW